MVHRRRRDDCLRRSGTVGAMAGDDDECAADARYGSELRRTAAEDARRDDTRPFRHLGRGEAALRREDDWLRRARSCGFYQSRDGGR